MKLKDLGEFNLIKRLTKNIKGIGDDTAVLRYTKDKFLLFTTDMLVEGRHFYRKYGGYLIGRKSLSVNISDIASMGGVPKAFVISLGAPASLEVKFIDDLYRGIKDAAKKFKIDLVGGDTVGSAQLIINISLLGEVEKKNLVLRKGAKYGDVIFVTGTIGGALKGKHLSFTPRLKEARFLVKNFKIHSMIDVSDGLMADLGHILDESRKGADIYEDRIPLSEHAKDFNSAIREGEDFELVFTISEREKNKLIKNWPFKTRLSYIGRVSNTKPRIKMQGYTHF